MSSKVMVIGAKGWLGHTLVGRLISEQREIIFVDYWRGNKPELPLDFKKYGKIRIVNADIRSLEGFDKELDGCKTVFNCAGMQHPIFTSDIYSVNRDGAANLLRKCIKARVKNFIHISSSSVHGENTRIRIPITEKTPFKPITHYSISKVEGEKLLRVINKQSKIKVSIIRPGVFYGKNPSQNLIKMIENIQKGFAVMFGKNGFLRTYVDIEKVADSMILAEIKGKNGEAYLIGDIAPISTLQLYQTIASEINVNLKVVRLPTIISRFCEKAAYLSGKLNLHLRYPNIIGEFGRNHFFSSKKAVKELSYKPHLNPEKGLRQMVTNWKKF